MDTTLATSLAWIMALCSGLMAGTYFAFSGFIMRSFASLGPARAVAAMNAINSIILKSAFMPLFFGSTVIGMLMALLGFWQWGEPGAGLAVVAGLTYVIGMFVLTATANVPLNNALAKISGDSDEAAQAWAHYFNRWTRWNSVRAIASLATLVLCIELLSL